MTKQSKHCPKDKTVQIHLRTGEKLTKYEIDRIIKQIREGFVGGLINADEPLSQYSWNLILTKIHPL
jgi:hypothetical protein